MLTVRIRYESHQALWVFFHLFSLVAEATTGLICAISPHLLIEDILQRAEYSHFITLLPSPPLHTHAMPRHIHIHGYKNKNYLRQDWNFFIHMYSDSSRGKTLDPQTIRSRKTLLLCWGWGRGQTRVILTKDCWTCAYCLDHWQRYPVLLLISFTQAGM